MNTSKNTGVRSQESGGEGLSPRALDWRAKRREIFHAIPPIAVINISYMERHEAAESLWSRINSPADALMECRDFLAWMIERLNDLGKKRKARDLAKPLREVQRRLEQTFAIEAALRADDKKEEQK